MSSTARTSKKSSDLPLFLGSIVAMVLSGLLIFLVVDASIPDGRRDSNSPNGVTPGPDSSFDVR